MRLADLRIGTGVLRGACGTGGGGWRRRSGAWARRWRGRRADAGRELAGPVGAARPGAGPAASAVRRETRWRGCGAPARPAGGAGGGRGAGGLRAGGAAASRPELPLGRIGRLREALAALDRLQRVAGLREHAGAGLRRGAGRGPGRQQRRGGRAGDECWRSSSRTGGSRSASRPPRPGSGRRSRRRSRGACSRSAPLVQSGAAQDGHAPSDADAAADEAAVVVLEFVERAGRRPRPGTRPGGRRPRGRSASTGARCRPRIRSRSRAPRAVRLAYQVPSRHSSVPRKAQVTRRFGEVVLDPVGRLAGSP